MKLKIVSYRPKHEKSVQKTIYDREVFFSTTIKEKFFWPSKVLGVYPIILKPREYGCKNASDLFGLLNPAKDAMQKYKDMGILPILENNPPKGQEKAYEEFFDFLSSLVDALKNYPDARIEVSQ